MTQSCTNYSTIVFNDNLIQNNAWGFDGQNPPQCIFGPPGSLIGWNWSWPGDNASRVVSYPQIIHGKKPWNTESTSAQLPAPLSSLASVNVAYEVRTPASGAYNLAFDLWITNNVSSNEDDIVTEVMVWVSQHGLNPAGTFVETLDSPYGEVDLFETQMERWNYFAFVCRNELLAATLDLKVFLDYLVTSNRISSNQFLASVEFGNEIAFGQGVTTVDRYEVIVSI